MVRLQYDGKRDSAWKKKLNMRVIKYIEHYLSIAL